MSSSQRFRPIQRIATHKERKAAAALGESLKQREAATQRLTELQQYREEYLERFAHAARRGLTSSQALEYQVFIGKLETAIAQQEQILAQTQQDCDAHKADWRGRYTKAKAMDNAVGRMHETERRDEQRKEQVESDERTPHKR